MIRYYGILISRDPEDPHIVLLEFARTSDDTLHFSGLRRATKELKYLSLQRALHHLYPQATIDFSHSSLDRVPLYPKWSGAML